MTVTVHVTGGKVSPPPDRVKITPGQRVRIEVHSDRADTVHVHGYDLASDVTPGTPATIAFTADRTGVFEVETHHVRAVLTQLQVG